MRLHSEPRARAAATRRQYLVGGAVGNVYCDKRIGRHFIRGQVQAAIKPLIGIEEFGAGLIG